MPWTHTTGSLIPAKSSEEKTDNHLFSMVSYQISWESEWCYTEGRKQVPVFPALLHIFTVKLSTLSWFLGRQFTDSLQRQACIWPRQTFSGISFSPQGTLGRLELILSISSHPHTALFSIIMEKRKASLWLHNLLCLYHTKRMLLDHLSLGMERPTMTVQQPGN